MSNWICKDAITEYNLDHLYRDHITPTLSDKWNVIDHHVSVGVIYIFAASKNNQKKQILIAQFQLNKNSFGFRVLEEQVQPHNFDCPTHFISNSQNPDPKAVEWREANSNLSIQRKILMAIAEPTQHLADNFATVQEWRKLLKKGMPINSEKYGVVIFDRTCKSLIQFLFVKDKYNNDLYCHFNDFHFDEINSAITEWNGKNGKSKVNNANQ